MSLRAQLDEFFSRDALGGIFLMLSAIAALTVANSPLQPFYDGFLNSYLTVQSTVSLVSRY